MTHDAAGHGPVPGSQFSAAEIDAFHAEDRAAARNIVLLMLLIFLIGIALYTTVDLAVAS